MLSWYVYVGDFNAGVIKEFNVFQHGGFMQDVEKAVRRKLNREQFEKEIRTSLMYWYWSKCEWEVIIDHWPHSDRRKDIKVDVFDQVMMNWNHFITYLWKNRKEALPRQPVVLSPGEEEQMVMEEFDGA